MADFKKCISLPTYAGSGTFEDELDREGEKGPAGLGRLEKPGRTYAGVRRVNDTLAMCAKLDVSKESLELVNRLAIAQYIQSC